MDRGRPGLAIEKLRGGRNMPPRLGGLYSYYEEFDVRLQVIEYLWYSVGGGLWIFPRTEILRACYQDRLVLN
jgi:hypothetical protein